MKAPYTIRKQINIEGIGIIWGILSTDNKFYQATNSAYTFKTQRAAKQYIQSCPELRYDRTVHAIGKSTR